MTSRRIVLFDIDGTLLRGAGPEHKQALIDAARTVMDVECTLDGVDTTGCLDPDLLRLMLTNAGITKRRIAEYMARLLEAAQHDYSVHCKKDFSDKLCPGVRSMVQLLARHQIPLGIVTGNLSAIAFRKLANARIDQYFQFGAYAEQARSRAGLAKLAVSQARRKHLAANRCSVTLVGDHANDIEAAKLNGFRSVAVATGLMPAEDLRRIQPDLLLANLEGVSIDVLCGS